ncbi:MAG: UDP-N-acetylglucosamine 2-epimerase [Candidatus Gracilibacteria bacterium]|jgi:UDP-N-acetylglucosamine 2-epimerase (non-hydrolysing)|nr:UDP-N-acetylglucosamine 2-epimerase [Candidatus Gracilibacteria bacterium]
MNQEVSFNNNFESKINQMSDRIFMIMIATKPDIIKQAPLYFEMKKKGLDVLLVHTGQHYDFNLSGGMLEEFGLEVDIKLSIKGSLHQKTAQMIERFGDVLFALKEQGKTLIPIVHGDTTTASACSNAAYCNGFVVIHNEAGVRTLTPKKSHYKKLLETQDIDWWFSLMQDEENFEKGSLEPCPEQFNTRCSEPATGIFLAPHDIDRRFLLEEGFDQRRIYLVGNSVVDATHQAIKDAEKSDIFEKYPLLEQGFTRFCIHRRENCENEKRFVEIFNAMKILVDSGENVLLISLFATESAIDRFGLRSELEELIKKPNFVYSGVWPYYRDVIKAMTKCKCCATDSGSMQEEMNEMNIPCVTLRFGSDRSETFFAGSNVVAPPVSSEIIYKIIQKVINENLLKNTPRIYGKNVSEKIADILVKYIEQDKNFILTEEERIFGD